MQSKYQFYVYLSLLFLVVNLSSCCKCSSTKVEDVNRIRVTNHEVTEFTNPCIVYYQGTTIVDTIQLTCDTIYQYLSGAFSLVAGEVLNFNYDWDLQANDSLSFYFSQFEIKTTAKKSCCASVGTNYLASYYLDSVKQSKSILMIE